MLRYSHSSVPACPTLFTPLQIHTREMLQLGIGAWVGWMRDHIVSLQKMVEEYEASVVVAGASLEYFRGCGFHDGDTIYLDTTSTVRKNGALIEGITEFRCGEKPFAKTNIMLRPVIIGDTNSAAAKPGDLLPELRDLFQPEEFNPEPCSRQAKKLVLQIENEGILLAKGSTPFKLHRFAMDFADQWAFMETAAFVGASRENIALAHAGNHERLIEGVSSSVKKYALDLHKPFFLFDDGRVDTCAYLWNEKVVFVHRLVSEQWGKTNLHATVIEEMNV